MRAVKQKEAAIAIVRELGFAFSINVVLHRANLDRVGEIIELAASLGADRLELANTQYYGWALENRRALMPTRAQVVAAQIHRRGGDGALSGPDADPLRAAGLLRGVPEAVLRRLGKHYLVVMPDGRTLPCHGATHITTLRFDTVRDRSLGWIWTESPAFQAFRGDEWMQEPCRSCPRKAIDFGGCRCQAFALTGDATNTDPVCTLTPLTSHHRCAPSEAADGPRRLHVSLSPPRNPARP